MNSPSKIQDNAPPTQAAVSLFITQLMKFKAIKYGQKQKKNTSSIGRKKGELLDERHALLQETPLPLYIGMMLHEETRDWWTSSLVWASVSQTTVSYAFLQRWEIRPVRCTEQ